MDCSPHATLYTWFIAFEFVVVAAKTLAWITLSI